MSELKAPLVLAVDDNEINLKVISSIIEEMGYECTLAMNGKEALAAIEAECPDLILLDVMMPDSDGYSVCKELKSQPLLSSIPVIFLTALAEPEDIVKGFEVGGVDYILKPFNAAELKIRIKTHIELKRSKNQLEVLIRDLKESNDALLRSNEIVLEKNKQLEKLTKELKYTSNTDPLTALYNRRYMTKRLEEELLRAKRYDNKFTVIIGDIDHFKLINDHYGHECGDFILKEFALVLKACLREQDSLARWGGEEFLMMIPETDLNGGLMLAERIRQTVEKSIYHYEDAHIKFTITFGVAQFQDDETVSELVKRADDGLYRGKAHGRNKVVACSK